LWTLSLVRLHISFGAGVRGVLVQPVFPSGPAPPEQVPALIQLPLNGLEVDVVFVA